MAELPQFELRYPNTKYYIGDTIHLIVTIPAGSTTNVTRFNIKYRFGDITENIGTFTIQRDINKIFQQFITISTPITLYNEIPDSKSGSIDITATFIDNYAVNVGVKQITCALHANENYCSPTISLPTVSVADALSQRLTGDPEKLIRYISTAHVGVTAKSQHGTTLDVVTAWNGGGSLVTIDANGKTESRVECDLNNVETNVIYISALDARGFDTTIRYTFPVEKFVEYIKLTCNAEYRRPDTDGNITLTCSGNYFNDAFGNYYNSLLVEYRYKENDGEFTEWAAMTATTNGNTYIANTNIEGLNYQSKYTFEYRAIDEVMTAYSADYVTKATPVFDWSEYDFAFNVPVDFREGITIKGEESDLIEEQGTSGDWYYRKWQSGRAECWGRFTRSVYGSDWTAWGSLYQAEIIANKAYPFTFTDTQTEIATLHSMSGGLLNSSAIGMSQSTTGAHFAVHPNKLSSTYSFTLSLYVVGRWK